MAAAACSTGFRSFTIDSSDMLEHWLVLWSNVIDSISTRQAGKSLLRQEMRRLLKEAKSKSLAGIATMNCSASG